MKFCGQRREREARSAVGGSGSAAPVAARWGEGRGQALGRSPALNISKTIRRFINQGQSNLVWPALMRTQGTCSLRFARQAGCARARRRAAAVCGVRVPSTGQSARRNTASAPSPPALPSTLPPPPRPAAFPLREPAKHVAPWPEERAGPVRCSGALLCWAEGRRCPCQCTEGSV